MDQAALTTIERYEAACPFLAVPHREAKLRYAVPNQATLWRVQTLMTKEPGTIQWLESIKPDSVLLDVGANVGMYTVFAAVVSGARVFAFEPESQNYALLCKNILANKVGDRVTAYCAALSDATKFSTLHLSTFGFGRSCHTFDASVDFQLRRQTGGPGFPDRPGANRHGLARRGRVRRRRRVCFPPLGPSEKNANERLADVNRYTEHR